VLVGLALPCGPATLLASWVRKNDRDLSNRDANQLALGASYTVSRRTDFYASYSRITSRGGAGDSLGNPTSSAAASSALNLGMRHGF
jgi:predicted porin